MLRQLHVQWIVQTSQVVLDLGDLTLQIVVLVQIEVVLFGTFVDRQQILPVLHVPQIVFLQIYLFLPCFYYKFVLGINTDLSGDAVVCVHGHGGAVGDEVGHRLHNIPGVFPPGQSSQDSELDRHQAQAEPSQHRSLPLRFRTKLALFLLKKNENKKIRKN